MQPTSKNTAPVQASGRWLRLDPRSGSLADRRYRVQILSGPDAGHVVALSGPLQVGSSPDAGLALKDTTVSKLHLELQPRSDGVRVRDLGSTNGTYVAGVRLQDAILEDETTLSLGTTKLRVSIEEEDLGRPEPKPAFGELCGQGPAMRSLFGILDRVAPSDAAVLVLGETGSGKELVARSLHRGSGRKAGPFVTFDCAAVSSNLVESELFGHVKGAFTDAVTNRTGAFVDADGGTLFLDEIGELPLELQPKLLRVLETGTVKPVGGDLFRTVSVRVVAATHRDLEKEVAAGRFRQDLYFRLAVIPVSLPPLRERTEDLSLLIARFAATLGRHGYVIPESLLGALRRHTWPGNVRELRNVVSRMLALYPEGGVTLEGAPLEQLLLANDRRPSGSYPLVTGAAPADDERSRILRALEEAGGNQKAAAERLGISRGTLISRLEAYGIPRPRKR